MTHKRAKNTKKVKPSIKLQKQISVYCNGFIKALRDGKVPAPSGADCWHCYMQNETTQQSWGESVKDADHLITHMDEEYYVPSLLFNAAKQNGISKFAQAELYTYWTDINHPELSPITIHQVKQALWRYLHRAFHRAN
jgi:hypothetical protein